MSAKILTLLSCDCAKHTHTHTHKHRERERQRERQRETEREKHLLLAGVEADVGREEDAGKDLDLAVL
jgi:hypothetical protein